MNTPTNRDMDCLTENGPTSAPSAAGVLLALAERCEREESSRELDAAIAVQMGIAPNYEGDGIYGCRVYTTSLDAAATLVPEGWGLHFTKSRPSVSTKATAGVMSPGGQFLSAHCNNGALAICAAALRARASLVQS